MRTAPENLDQLTPKEAVKLCLKETFEDLKKTLPWYQRPLMWLLVRSHMPKLEQELEKHVVEQRAAGRADITDEGVKAAFKRAGLPA